MDVAFTPRFVSYQPGLMGGLTGPDAELREIQDKVLDIIGPLGTAYEHLLDKLDPPSSTIQFSREEGTGLMAVIQRSIQLAGHASATISQKRWVAVLTKVNKAYASLGKEDFPDVGKDLFGKGFESRLKSECPLRPSEQWHMMKNQNSLYFAQRQPMVGLETWWVFFLEKSFQPAKNLQNRCGPTCLQKHAK